MEISKENLKEFAEGTFIMGYDPNQYRICPDDLDDHISKGLKKLRGSFEMCVTKYSSGFRGIRQFSDEFDTDAMENAFGDMTEDFIVNFINGEQGYNLTLKQAMRVLAYSDIGARAIGILDIDEPVYILTDGGTKKVKLTDADAAFLCTTFIETDIVYKDIAPRLIKIFNSTKDYNEFSRELVDVSSAKYTINDLLDKPVECTMALTSLLGIPIQPLFKYKFYEACDNYLYEYSK